ncbi:MAG: tetratricopeptide repeat protein [Paludisphaera borealis]|uniref:tetratricopeptide repeat protein n=1 Tax=Paludisphaera borealis TaxID=1387353 RepID=UPI00283B88A6|nr:tetratricopeptide repeat protein [Paludisphaera borealis]MDR3620393.1 tetratricopeptide repeat protein [Paludisphaera borealis]
MPNSLVPKGRRVRVAVAIAVAIGAVYGLVVLEGWWARTTRQDAFRRLARRDFAGAQPGLARLLALHRGDGEAWFQLGLCESALGREPAARAAWDSVPIGSPFAGRAAVRRARQELASHRLAAAETYLLRAVDERGAHAVEAFETLVHLFKIEGRFREVRRLVNDWWEDYPNRISMVTELTQLDTPSAYAPAKAREALDRAGAAAPDDDRVWLGKANLAMRTGDLDQAGRWLEACERERPDDAAVGRARIALAEANRDAPAVRRAAARVAPGTLDPEELARLRAWLAAEANDQAAEGEALRALLAIRADDAPALERLAELEILAGRAAESARLRAHKAELDRARWRFDNLIFLTRAQDHGRELARLAESLGRSVEARICWKLVLDREPGDAEALQAIAQLDARARSATARRTSSPRCGPSLPVRRSKSRRNRVSSPGRSTIRARRYGSTTTRNRAGCGSSSIAG